MKFERINENKIRITLTSKDLQDKCIDFHSFMSSPIDSQDLFLDMLDEAEEKIGFSVGEHNLKIEAVAVSDEKFIFTITKIEEKDSPKKKFKRKIPVKRKEHNLSSLSATYCFYSFEDFCDFLNVISTYSKSIQNIAKSADLYQYKNNYYLVLSNINIDNPSKLIFYSYITEFARYTNNSAVFVSKLKESGNIILKNNALKFKFGQKI